jgi:predicted aconitase
MMHLTNEEEEMLRGENGHAMQKSMEILVAIGDIYGAEQMIPVENVHMPGSSVVVAGDAGSDFVREMADTNVKFKVRTTLNPAAIDFERWEKLGIPGHYAEKQKKLSASYEKMGAILCHTCTPYLTGNLPRFKEHVAWGESSAISFVNSILGARTNREGGPSALASAIAGRTPLYGLHLNENRKGKLHVKVSTELTTVTDFGALGYYVGKISKGENTVFTGISRNVSIDTLKMLGAALASSGSVALYHIVGITPEAPTLEKAFLGNKPDESLEFGPAELKQAHEQLSGTPSNRVDVVCIGCPHCSIFEIRDVAQRLSSQKVHANVRLWICAASQVKSLSDRMGYTKIIEAAGGLFMCDTCPVLAPTREMSKIYDLKTIATNSAKLANYAVGQCNLQPYYGEMDRCISAAVTGRLT